MYNSPPNFHLSKLSRCLAFQPKMEGFVFGCDICQEVCPWNKFSEPHNEPRFEPQQGFYNWGMDEWKGMDEELFNVVFGKTPLTRAGWQKFKNSLGT